MAFSGLHVTAGYPGPFYNRGKAVPVLGKLAASQTMASAGTTTIVAPPAREGAGMMPIFRVQAAADSWVSIGPSPDASAGTRTLVRSGVDYDFFVEPGDKLAWVAA